MDPILEKLKTLEAKYVYAILVCAIGVVVAIDAAVLLGPQLAGIGGINKKIEEARADIETLVTNNQRLPLFQKQLEIAKLEKKNFDCMVNPKDAIPVVLKNISSFANDYGIKIDQLVPHQSNQELLVTAEDGKYYSVPILIKARAGYHNLGKFMNRLERERVFWKLEEFSLVANEIDPQKHEATMLMKIIIVEK
ncbi:MAG: type 4a pilus biogenesis protein PilO [Candidatus Omnitrophica bacterium]|nr:type 4a pilus biogenesis protein PilO [Candidatus Omnitrophota bacterium]